MSTRVEYIRAWRAKVTASMNKLAHSAVSGVLPADKYHEIRGRYKQLAELLGEFDREIQRINGDPDDTGPPVDDTPRRAAATDEDDFEAPRPPQRRRQARGWPS